jgi:hypothetical protein
MSLAVPQCPQFGAQAYRDDDVRHVSILSDNLQSFHGLRISDNIFQIHRSILLNPDSSEHTNQY